MSPYRLMFDMIVTWERPLLARHQADCQNLIEGQGSRAANHLLKITKAMVIWTEETIIESVIKADRGNNGTKEMRNLYLNQP